MRTGAGSHPDSKRGDPTEESRAEIWNVTPRLSGPGANALPFLLTPAQKGLCPLFICGTRPEQKYIMSEPSLNPGMNFGVTLAVRAPFARGGNEVQAIGCEHVVGP